MYIDGLASKPHKLIFLKVKVTWLCSWENRKVLIEIVKYLLISECFYIDRMLQLNVFCSEFWQLICICICICSSKLHLSLRSILAAGALSSYMKARLELDHVISDLICTDWNRPLQLCRSTGWWYVGWTRTCNSPWKSCAWCTALHLPS